MRIIGIDPGSNKIGVSIIEIDNSGKIIDKQWETIKLKGETHLERLSDLKDRVAGLIHKMYAILNNKIGLSDIEFAVIEEPVIGLSPRSSISLIQARGVILSELISLAPFFTEAGINVFINEINPKTVKKLTTGNGNAKKEDIQIAVQKIFDIQEKIPEDAADALAIAYSGWKLNEK